MDTALAPRYVNLLKSVTPPRMALARQSFAGDRIDDVPGALKAAYDAAPGCLERVKPGMSVAITAGSRGLASLVPMLQSIVASVTAQGAHPFIVPAMGSHGGATDEGQASVLKKLGVTEESMGCPIRSSMETVEIAVLPNGMPVKIDRLAHESDGIIVFNRVKPHTSFRHLNESGVIKMLAIGLGKQSGAELCHSWGLDHLGPLCVEMAQAKIDNSKVLFAVATIENAYDQLNRIVVMPPEGMVEAERPLLAEAMGNLPRLPLGDPSATLASGPLDVLVVDWIGKEYSGTGMDPNITGRFSSDSVKMDLKIKRLAVLDLTDKSDGNSNGVARACVITDRLYGKFSREAVYANCLTSNALQSAAMPMSMPDDLNAIRAAIKSCEARDMSAVRMIRIPNTLQMEWIQVSEAMLPELADRPGIEIVEGPAELQFTNGWLDKTFWPGFGAH